MEEKMDSFPYSRLVITGGCGYVGRQLANALREAHPGIEIVLFDVLGKLVIENNINVNSAGELNGYGIFGYKMRLFCSIGKIGHPIANFH